MIEYKKLKRKLYKLYPISVAKKNHDFVGQMIPTSKEKISRIVVCLDLDRSILDKIEAFNADLVITHHPFLFGRSKVSILRNDEDKAYVYNFLKERNIAVISLHTNFDECHNGMNDALAALLDLNDVYAPIKEPMMRIGTLKEALSIDDFAIYAKDKLNVKYALLIKEGKSFINKVGIIGGGGSRDYTVALEEDCDIYISGDAPHHVRRDIVNKKFNYLDVPHEVERVFIKKMKEVLLSIDSSLYIEEIDHEIEPGVI